MPVWLTAWTGDNAGKVQGRQYYRALITVTNTDGDYPSALFQESDLNGTLWYHDIEARCLTPGSMFAIVTEVEMVGDAYSLEMTPWQFSGTPTGEWQPGVHLFSIWLLGGKLNTATTIATVVVPPKISIRRPLKLSEAAAERVLGQRRRAKLHQLPPKSEGVIPTATNRMDEAKLSQIKSGADSPGGIQN